MSNVVDMSGAALDPEIEFHKREFLDGYEEHPGEALASVIQLNASEIGDWHASRDYAQLRKRAQQLVVRLDEMAALQERSQ